MNVLLEDGGDVVRIEVRDDGDLLPPNFDMTQTNSLGLQIVRTLVQGDLHGKTRTAKRRRRSCGLG